MWDGMDESALSKTKEILDDMHKRKIDMADSIYVINIEEYIGDRVYEETWKEGFVFGVIHFSKRGVESEWWKEKAALCAKVLFKILY